MIDNARLLLLKKTKHLARFFETALNKLITPVMYRHLVVNWLDCTIFNLWGNIKVKLSSQYLKAFYRYNRLFR